MYNPHLMRSTSSNTAPCGVYSTLASQFSFWPHSFITSSSVKDGDTSNN